MSFLLGLFLGWLITICMYTYRLVQDEPKWKFSKQHNTYVTMRIVDQDNNHITWSDVYRAVNGK